MIYLPESPGRKKRFCLSFPYRPETIKYQYYFLDLGLSRKTGVEEGEHFKFNKMSSLTILALIKQIYFFLGKMNCVLKKNYLKKTVKLAVAVQFNSYVFYLNKLF